MRDIALSMFVIVGFCYALNAMFHFLGDQFGTSDISNLGITNNQLNSEVGSSLSQLNSSSGWQTNFIFGDWTKVQSLINLFTLQDLVNIMSNLNMPQSFTEPVRLGVFGLLGIGALIYYITGRQ